MRRRSASHVALASRHGIPERNTLSVTLKLISPEDELHEGVRANLDCPSHRDCNFRASANERDKLRALADAADEPYAMRLA